MNSCIEQDKRENVCCCCCCDIIAVLIQYCILCVCVCLHRNLKQGQIKIYNFIPKIHTQCFLFHLTFCSVSSNRFFCNRFWSIESLFFSVNFFLERKGYIINNFIPLFINILGECTMYALNSSLVCFHLLRFKFRVSFSFVQTSKFLSKSEKFDRCVWIAIFSCQTS